MSGDCCSSTARDCCGDPVEATVALQVKPGICPACGGKGKAVDGRTVKALLAVSLLQVTREPYLFCRTPECPVVYYSADGMQTFTTEQVRERVYQKELQAEDVPVCYCFRHTVGSVRAEIERTGGSTVVEEITAGTRAGYCACDIRNPQGSCCLGNVGALVKRLLAATSSTEQS
jgi:hypothetical protein